jgi:Integrase zinc binding domain/Integrase core domain/RNase H-like domain found in reverse transcriptase
MNGIGQDGELSSPDVEGEQQEYEPYVFQDTEYNREKIRQLYGLDPDWRTANFDRVFASPAPILLNFGAKYKPVAAKKNPVPVSVPVMKREPYKPIPIPVLPELPTHPPPWEEFQYTEKLTKERVEAIINTVPPGFLRKEELDLLVWVVGQNEHVIAYEDSERGRFKSEYFPDYVMETVPHVPWRLPPIRIADAIKDEVRNMVRKQIESGNLEPSTSSYRSRIFTVLKKNGKLRIVHDLQPLNEVSVQDSMLPPNVAEFADEYVGYSIYGTMDLYSGYHQRAIHPNSRPLTACHTPMGNVQLTSLPMGYTNSMQEFQRSTSHIVHHLAPERASSFVDDIGTKGPQTRYNDEPIAENPQIRRFVWEYAHTVYECLAVIGTAGATISGAKFTLATPVVTIVGYDCSLDGIKPHHGIITKVLNWPTPRNVTEVRGFLGTIGVARSWIRNFAGIAKPLTELTRATADGFQWSDQAQRAVEILKRKVTEVAALKKLDIALAKKASMEHKKGEYCEGRVVLAVDSSIEAIGFVVYQMFRSDDRELKPEKQEKDPNTAKPRVPLRKFPIRYGSITLNQTESRYGQPKIELYGLFRALRALEHLLWGINVLVEMDASFIKAMVNSPGLPNAAATRWIVYIRLFDLEFKHIPGTSHQAPDGLSRRAHADEDSEDTGLDSEFDEAGPFITSSRLIHTEAAVTRSPMEVALEPKADDARYVASTRLWSRNGEPVNMMKRDDVTRPEEWQLLTIESPAKGTIAGLYSILTIEMPKVRGEPDEVITVAATTRNQIKRDKEREKDNNPSEQPENVNRKEPPEQDEDRLRLHPNHVLDDDRDEYWTNLIKYLQTWNVPKDVQNKKSFKQMAHKYYIFQNALWRRSTKTPRRVILNKLAREQLVKQAHDESGHRGRDPTYRKLADFYFWPNMYAEIALYCRTCRRCQLRSTYRPKVMINPTWVPTVMRKFNMDLVEMGIPSSGYEYIVDIRDDLTGWLEARMLAKKSSDDIAQFLWQDVICRFGCVPQITTDNGTEFHKAVSILARRYGITILRTSPYNPAANGMIERGHRTWINSIWKLCGNRKHRWSHWFYHALWADRVTTRRSTGFSPYYLLYGRPHLFPYNLKDETWYTVDWHDIRSTEDLIAVRALQIRQLHMDRKTASDRNARARIQAAKDYAIKHARRLVSGIYREGELVIVALKGPGIVRGGTLAKSEDTWAGPFRIVRRFNSGSYQIEELDGSILRGTIPAGHLKPFYTRESQIKGSILLPEGDSSEEGNPFEKSDGEDDLRDPDFALSDE